MTPSGDRQAPQGASPEVSVQSSLTWGWKRRGERLGGAAYAVVLVLSALGLTLVINQTFYLGIAGFRPISTQYYYLLIALFLAVSFLMFAGRERDAAHIPFFDWLLAAASLTAGGFLAVEAETMISQGWDILAPTIPAAVSGVFTLLALEAVRRAGGMPLFIICLVFGAYPLFAGHMPGFLWGMNFTLAETVSAHVMGAEGVLGIPMRVVADLLVGFMVFGVVLASTGGGEFFMGFATSLMGKSRGGPAKVAIISSGLFGSLSGSVISNVVTTGTITIPTMRRCGYPPAYAAAVEASASTGGALMPPVMGAVAFIMASFLNTSYSTIMVAATVPAVLFYAALVLQADAYAARNGLKGLEAKDIPSLRDVMRKGWYYGIGLLVLIYLLIFTSQEARAPYYVALVILACVAVFDRAQLRLPRLLDLLVEVGKNVAHLVAILAGVGLIVGALSVTGVGNAFSRELIQYAGTSVPLLLILGAATSFVLGMGMTVSACYVFLAIVLAPALTQLDLSPLAVHLFILYWGMLSYITPPVAIAAVAAAHIAGAKPLKTGFMAVRLALVVFVLPFIFVVNPALILEGPLDEVVVAVVTTSVAVWLLSAGFERYLYFVGPLSRVQSVVVLAAAATLMVPGHHTDLIGVALICGLYTLHLLTRRRAAAAAYRLEN